VLSKWLTVVVLVLTLTIAGLGFVETRADNISSANGSEVAPAAGNGGSRSHALPIRIRDAQQALKDEGLYKGPINGEWSPDTEQAVAQFQKKNGLKQTAELDGQTQDQLEHADND
jgi:peptidoglycan hydrolase-like protein with peptidoglycan-binding domain